MRTPLLSVVLCVSTATVAVGLAACGGSSSKADVSTAFNKTLKATILVDSRGRSLYLFGLDSPNNTPTCVDDSTYHCSKAWPPLIAHGSAGAGKGVKASLLKTVKRTDGTMQVTYKGYPLYTFNGYHLGNAPDAPADTKPGDIHGQGYVSAWWVLSPAGKAITTQPSASG
jgi:predicted lipoprotein with Yx(FWY)xxD motif